MSLQIGTLLKDKNFREIIFEVLTIDGSYVTFQRVNESFEILGLPVYGELLNGTDKEVRLKTSKGIFEFILKNI